MDTEPLQAERWQTMISQLHHVVQLIAVVNANNVPDWSANRLHPISWDTKTHTFWSQWSVGNNPWRIGCNIANFTLQIDTPLKAPLATLPLHLEEKSTVQNWLQWQLFELHTNTFDWAWTLPYSLPPYPYEQGVPYRKPGANSLRQYISLHQLTQWVLRQVYAEEAVTTASTFSIELPGNTYAAGWRIPDDQYPFGYWFIVPVNITDGESPRIIPTEEIMALSSIEQAEALTAFYRSVAPQINRP